MFKSVEDQFGVIHFRMKNPSKFLRILEWDLFLEMLVDLSSIYFGLYLLKHACFFIHPNGWMELWKMLINAFGDNAYVMYVYGNLAVLLVVYWIPVLFYTLIDVFQPHFLYQYKVQIHKSQVKLTWRLIMDVILKVTSNQVFQTFIGSQISWRFRYQYINMDTPLEVVPSLNE